MAEISWADYSLEIALNPGLGLVHLLEELSTLFQITMMTGKEVLKMGKFISKT